MRLMKILVTALFFVLTLFPAQPGYAKAVDRIVAIVNDSVITQKDLDDRFALMKRQMRLELNEKQRQELHARTLGTLIDEELYKQYSEGHGLYVTPQEVERAIESLESQSGLTPGSFDEMAQGLSKTARKQVSGNILWQKIIERNIRPKVSIPNDEIDLLIRNLLAQSQTVEREISHILLTAETLEEEQKIKEKIADVYRQLEAGEDFSTLAKTYSMDSNSAANSGYLGWFSTGEMAPALEKELEMLEVDGYSHPVKSPAGWHILKLDSIRKTQKVSSAPINEINLWKVSADITTAEAEPLRKLKKAMKNIDESEDISEIIKDFGEDINLSGSGSLGWVAIDDIGIQMLRNFKEVEPNTLSKLVESPNTLEVYFIKSKRTSMSEQFQKYRDRVRERLTDNRVELLARKFLRGLRRKAYIDVRL
jgi:peptidyl-prolyl cis-trans isomerase SurA